MATPGSNLGAKGVRDNFQVSGDGYAELKFENLGQKCEEMNSDQRR